MTPFASLVLTAGRSQRMGRAKAWLHFQGKPLLERIVHASAAGGAALIVVVVGCEDAAQEPALVGRIDVAERLVAAPGLPRVSIAVGNPEATPIASIRAGLELVPPGFAVLLWPVDHPFADAALVAELARALAGAADRIAAPAVDGRRAHPVLLGATVAAELTAADADGGAHLVVRRDPARVIEVPARDRRLLAELNTPEQARHLGVV